MGLLSRSTDRNHTYRAAFNRRYNHSPRSLLVFLQPRKKVQLPNLRKTSSRMTSRVDADPSVFEDSPWEVRAEIGRRSSAHRRRFVECGIEPSEYRVELTRRHQLHRSQFGATRRALRRTQRKGRCLRKLFTLGGLCSAQFEQLESLANDSCPLACGDSATACSTTLKF